MSKVKVVAEISANHGGSLDKALHLIEAAKIAGADAVKLQTYTPECITIVSDRPEFVIHSGPWQGKRLFELYAAAATPWDWHERLFQHAKDHGLECFSSPFSVKAVEFLAQFDPPAYKIASFEITDLQLIKRAAETGKRIIMSTGCASHSDLVLAVSAALFDAHDITLLHCVSEYPASARLYNLQRITELREEFGTHVGLSDHSLSLTLPVAAVALGATIVEKHLRLTGDYLSPDAEFSLEPHQFRRMVEAIHEAEAALQPAVNAGAMTDLKRSLYVVEDMEPGDTFNDCNLRSIRPSNGMPPRFLPDMLGRKASRRIPRGTPLKMDLVA